MAARHKGKAQRKLPSHSYKEVVKRLRKLGMEVVIKGGAKHSLKMRWPGGRRFTPVPAHKSVSKGTLKSILRYAGVTLDQYLNAD